MSKVLFGESSGPSSPLLMSETTELGVWHTYALYIFSIHNCCISDLRGTPLTKFLFTSIFFVNLSNPFGLTDSVCFHSLLCQQTPGGKLGCSDKKSLVKLKFSQVRNGLEHFPSFLTINLSPVRKLRTCLKVTPGQVPPVN